MGMCMERLRIGLLIWRGDVSETHIFMLKVRRGLGSALFKCTMHAGPDRESVALTDINTER